MNEFEKSASEQRGHGVFGEMWYFLATSKKWWLAPILIVMAMFGLLILFSGTAAAPFIYTLF